MSEFKSGEVVVFNNKDYIYLCEHPERRSLSLLELRRIEDNRSIFDCVITKYIERKQKTHKVNGFKVPAPLTEEELRRLRKSGEDDVVFCFSAEYFDGFYETRMDLISKIGINCGFVFKTEDDIKKNILAIQDIDPNQSK